MKRFAAIAIATVLALSAPATKQAAAAEGSPQQSVGQCEDSTITSVSYYFQDDPKSGFVVEFSSQLGVGSGTYDGTQEHARVVDRSETPNRVIAREHPGDRVRVCLVQYPQKDQDCDPDKDWRGRQYRVYDYRLGESYTGWNANHLCGGA
jgi:hypothetical protein